MHNEPDDKRRMKILKYVLLNNSTYLYIYIILLYFFSSDKVIPAHIEV